MSVAPSFPSRPVSDYERIVAVYNPEASNAAGWPQSIDDIRQNAGHGEPVVVRSEPNGADTASKLADTVQDGDILYIVGGDGLANDVAQFAGSRGAPDVALLFSHHGNACNAYHATKLSGDPDRPSKHLQQGHIERLFPLRASVSSSEGKYSQLGLTIISIGAIATGAAVLNQPEHRTHWLRHNPNTRLAYEIYLSLFKTIPRTRTLLISNQDDSQHQPVLDIFAAHAPEIAKLAKLNGQITDEEFMVGVIRNKLPWRLFPALYKLTQGTFPVEYLHAGTQSTSFKLARSRRNRTAMIQFDGEPRPLAQDSTINLDQVGHIDSIHRPIPVVTTRFQRLHSVS